MYIDTINIAEGLENKLPGIARGVIEQSNRLPSVYKKRFIKNPDSPLEHHPRWHQWGIMTHSKKFRYLHNTESRELITQWDLEKKIDSYLSKEIDSAPRSGLLQIVAPLHDLGKFDKVLENKDQKISFDFKGHERLSQLLVLSNRVRTTLEDYHLTPNQIKYIAECAGKHFELGKLRQKAKKSEHGYTMAYARSGQFQQDIQDLLPYFNGLAVEIGLLFLADSLSKTDVRIQADTDEELRKEQNTAEQELKERHLPPELIAAVMQRPVQIEIARQYLKIITEKTDKGDGGK
jgi:hypothetical protein